MRTQGAIAMTTESKTWTLITAASVLIAAALSFAAVEVPRLLSAALLEHVDFPGFDPTYNADGYAAFLDSWYLRPLGYAALAAVVGLIVYGFIRERRGAATAGAVAFFLPLFGHFARSMFFLAGLGLLRTLWLPILQVSHELLQLGDVVYLPYAAVVWLGAVAHVDIRSWLSWLVMGSGMLLFVLGTLTWFRCRLAGPHLAERGVYRLCRHPQYLGWLLWSYGLMLYLVRNYEGQHFKLGWGMPNSLPWLVSALVIVGVAWLEEIAMERHFGLRYAVYRDRTPFLLPLPRGLRRLLTVPVRLVSGTDSPRTGGQVLATIGLYGAILILLSLPFLLLHWPPRGGWWAFPYNVFPFT
jgi:protein-S-isoprenylcysteine O-methyltransferase Ste14